MPVQIVFTPFVTRQKFCEMVGVSGDVLERWIRDGRVPCVAMGKYSLVDLRVWLSIDQTFELVKPEPATAKLGRAQASLSRSFRQAGEVSPPDSPSYGNPSVLHPVQS